LVWAENIKIDLFPYDAMVSKEQQLIIRDANTKVHVLHGQCAMAGGSSPNSSNGNYLCSLHNGTPFTALILG